MTDRIGQLITDPKIIKSWLISRKLRDEYSYTIDDLERAKKEDPSLENQEDIINHDNPYYLVKHDFAI